ncbi:hypothetical protein M758_5G016700, partial [Ceratodon purpureus]
SRPCSRCTVNHRQTMQHRVLNFIITLQSPLLHRATPIQQPSCGFIKNLSCIRTPISYQAISLPTEDLQVTPEAPVRFSWSSISSVASKGRRSAKRSLRKHVILVPSN